MNRWTETEEAGIGITKGKGEMVVDTQGLGAHIKEDIHGQEAGIVAGLDLRGEVLEIGVEAEAHGDEVGAPGEIEAGAGALEEIEAGAHGRIEIGAEVLGETEIGVGIAIGIGAQREPALPVPPLPIPLASPRSQQLFKKLRPCMGPLPLQSLMNHQSPRKIVCQGTQFYSALSGRILDFVGVTIKLY